MGRSLLLISIFLLFPAEILAFADVEWARQKEEVSYPDNTSIVAKCNNDGFECVVSIKMFGRNFNFKDSDLHGAGQMQASGLTLYPSPRTATDSSDFAFSFRVDLYCEELDKAGNKIIKRAFVGYAEKRIQMVEVETIHMTTKTQSFMQETP